MLLNLPTQLGNEIHGKLHADYSSRPKHNKEYRTMLRTRETWAKRERCVNNVVYSRMAHKNKWTFADGSLNRACDHRSHTRRFCARFVEIDAVIKLAMLSLSASLGGGKAYNTWKYWVKA
jgi:hypothetical protein